MSTESTHGRSKRRAARINGTAAERFWPKVDKNGPIPECRPDLGQCWVWIASTNPLGYGMFRAAGHSGGKAYTWLHRQIHGNLPDGMELDHLCRNRACVRPDHLESVTHLENMKRGDVWKVTKAESMITHCPQGHPYDAENTYHYRNSRMCVACRVMHTRKKDAARKAALLLSRASCASV